MSPAVIAFNAAVALFVGLLAFAAASRDDYGWTLVLGLLASANLGFAVYGAVTA